MTRDNIMLVIIIIVIIIIIVYSENHTKRINATCGRILFCCSVKVCGQVAGACECGDEPSGSIKRGEFLDQLQTS